MSEKTVLDLIKEITSTPKPKPPVEVKIIASKELDSAKITFVEANGKVYVVVYDKSGYKKRQSAVQTALQIAIDNDDKELFKFLIENYSKIPSFDGGENMSERAVELLKYLLAKEIPEVPEDDP